MLFRIFFFTNVIESVISLAGEYDGEITRKKGVYSSDVQAIGRACTHVIGFFFWNL